MKIDNDLFQSVDAEAEADRRAEADLLVGRVLPHGAVKRWLESWGSARTLPRPRRDD